MREIPLTRGKVVIVDDEDYLELSKCQWYASKQGRTYYAVRVGPKVKGKRFPLIRMHAVILGTPVGMDSDHINGDGLDNRRENLRIVDHRTNQQNRHESKTSKYLGVYWDAEKKKWRAEIFISGKKRRLGRYMIEEDAAEAYQCACAELVGVQGECG
jgi:hypothetical protein